MLQELGIWHVASNCLTPIKIVLINGESEVASKSESEEFIFQGEKESDLYDDTTGDSIGLNCIQPTTSIHYPSSGVPCLNPRRNMTGDEPLCGL